jgi:putative ABC transport system permease protein
MFYKLIYMSLWNRRTSIILMLVSISLSITLLIGVEHLRREAKESFSKTISSTDLIIGARSGQVNLLLYSVFRIGDATNNISWKSYQDIASDKSIKWTVPISLGDSHKGFRVMGTTETYFEKYKYGNKVPLIFKQGKPFKGVYDAVLGYQVAKELGYNLDQEIILSHGMGKVSFSKHEDKPFKITGILAPTGTPVDRTVHISLAGIEAIHIGWQHGVKIPGVKISAEDALKHDLTPKAITAVFVGLKSKVATFSLQRKINQYKQEPLTAIIPGLALVQLWQVVGFVEKILIIISAFVVLTGLMGMVTTLLAGLNERRREMAILRALGAKPLYMFLLLMTESVLLAITACVIGVVTISLILTLLQPILISHYGLFIGINPFNTSVLIILALVVSIAAILGLLPSIIAYKRSLKDGLSHKV